MGMECPQRPQWRYSHSGRWYRVNIGPVLVFMCCLVYILIYNDSTSVTSLPQHLYVTRDGIRYAVVAPQEDDVPITVSTAPLLSAAFSSPPPSPPLTTPAAFYRRLHSPSGRCRKLVNIGGYGCTRRYEGNKDVCLDPEVMPPRNACLVYSFGVANDITFEDSLITLLGCQVHMFDPTVTYAGWFEEPKRAGRTFHTEGLSDHYHRRQFQHADIATMQPLNSLLRRYSSASAVIHYLKLDIEGEEWKVLNHLVRNHLLDNVVQFALELHALDLKTIPRSRWLQILQDRHSILMSVEALGFRKVSVSNNEHFLCKVDFSESNGTIAGDEDKKATEATDVHDSVPVTPSALPVHYQPIQAELVMKVEDEDLSEELDEESEEVDEQGRYEYVCQEVLYVRTVDTLPQNVT